MTQRRMIALYELDSLAVENSAGLFEQPRKVLVGTIPYDPMEGQRWNQSSSETRYRTHEVILSFDTAEDANRNALLTLPKARFVDTGNLTF